MNVNYEKVILLYAPSTYDVADVISSYIYRAGLQGGDYSYSTAVGLFNSVIGFILILIANMISKKFSETSLFQERWNEGKRNSGEKNIPCCQRPVFDRHILYLPCADPVYGYGFLFGPGFPDQQQKHAVLAGGGDNAFGI